MLEMILLFIMGIIDDYFTYKILKLKITKGEDDSYNS